MHKSHNAWPKCRTSDMSECTTFTHPESRWVPLNLFRSSLPSFKKLHTGHLAIMSTSSELVAYEPAIISGCKKHELNHRLDHGYRRVMIKLFVQFDGDRSLVWHRSTFCQYAIAPFVPKILHCDKQMVLELRAVPDQPKGGTDSNSFGSSTLHGLALWAALVAAIHFSKTARLPWISQAPRLLKSTWIKYVPVYIFLEHSLSPTPWLGSDHPAALMLAQTTSRVRLYQTLPESSAN